MFRYKHYTARYVQDRLALALSERLHPEWPWITRDMVVFLDSWLRPGDMGLEWGSGRSTRWYASRVAALTSVEHSQEWYHLVQGQIRQAGLTDKVTYIHASPAGGPSSDYVRVLEQIPDSSLDFAVVDGVERDHCAIGVIPKLRPGALLVIDNCNRYISRAVPSPAPETIAIGNASETWDAFAAATQAWRLYWTTNGVTDTAAWLKPLR